MAPSGRVDPFLGKINPSLEVNHDIEDIATERQNLIAESALELLGSGAEGERGAGADDIHDRLGLREIDFSVVEGPLGKLSGFRRARASAERQFQCASG